MMNASDDIQLFVKNCISFEQEKRPKMNEIMLFIGEQLNKKLKKSFNERKTKEMFQFFYEFVFFKFKYSNNILETAKSLFVKENYSSAKKYFDLLVDFKVPDAYFYMARFYQFGYSVPTNLLKAVEYFKLGSDFDDYKSNFILGQFYFYGIHGEKDIPKAIEYFQKSSKYFAEANYIIGGIYWEIYKDREKSMKYLKEAAAKNHLGAISSLGGLCLYDKDYDKAIEYFETAAKQNHLQSIFYLGVLYYSGTGFDKNYQKAREYFEIAAKQNDGSSYLYLGIIYENGFDVPKDFYKAKFYYEKAVEFGRLDANCNLGTLFYKGDKNIDPNFSKAKKYFEISVEQENPIGFLNLGLLYFKGEGVEKDYSKAKEYFELSAEKENISAFIHLGIIYLLGKGVVPDYQKSYEYFQKAADKENAQSFYYLGMLFENGFGVNINIQKTIEFYQQSAAMYYNTIKVYDNQDPDDIFFVEEYENNFFFYPSINNLGLIYLTELGYTDQDLAGKYLQKAGLNEYPFGQNNWGLLNQFFMKNINKAEYFFNKAATIYSFALSEYNLGYIYENVNNDFEEAIKHYKKALEYMNLPLIFHGNVIIDKRLQVSKSFVACFINLKLAYFSLLKDESQSNNEAKEYFINSIFHILFTLLLDDLNDSYEFEFKLLNDGNGSSLNLKDFFFNFPLFKFSNQINKSCSDWKIFEMNSNNKSRFRVIVIRCQRQNDQQNNEKILDNLMSSIGQIKISKICDGILTKDNNNNPNDFPENESEEIQQNLLSEPNIKESIENIFSKMNIQKFFILMDNLSESNLDDSRLNGNDSDVIFIKSLENSIERYLKYPKCLYQIFFRDMHHLKNEISNIIDLMNNILYTPPYSILFGRIQIKEKESK